MTALKRNQAKDAIQLRVVDLHKSYAGHEVLRGVTLDVYRGQINMVIGPSGSGKTVLMRQLIRLEKPDSGQIVLDGLDIAALDDRDLLPVRRKFGMVFQMSALFDSMTVFDNVAFPLREHMRLKPSEIRERVLTRLAELGIDHAANKLPSEISGGMQKRAALARALMLETEIILYDEPTTGLDPISSRTVDDLIVESQEKFGVTSIVISHDMVSVFRIGHHVNYLYKGRIEVSGAPEDVRHSNNTVLREFLDSSDSNAPSRTA